MFYPLSLFIGLRYTKAKRSNGFVSFVSLFSTGGILLGVMSLILVLSVMNGFEEKQKKRVLGAIPHVVITNQAQMLPDWQSVMGDIGDIANVEGVSAMVNAEAMVQTPKQLRAVEIQGIFPEEWAPATLKQAINLGRLDNLTPGSYKVLIGSELAKELDIGLNDKMRIISTRGSVFTPLGRIPSQRNFVVAGIFTLGSEADANQIFLHGVDAARLMRLPKGAVTGIRFFLDDPFHIQGFEQLNLPQDLYVYDWRTSHGQFFQAIKMEKNMIGMLLCLIVAVAAFNILSSSVMLVTDKEGEVAILKTLGMSNSNIIAVFMVQGAWSGVLGALFGAVIGILLALYINPLLAFLGFDLYAAVGGQLPVLFNAWQIVHIILGAMLLSFAATFYPAWRAARVKPAEALRYE
ncbi:lipoprotein-releasing ABC transporter permease subunit [Motilimonas cestriensis]|uniref:Lipoprotein-releasing ABC transporter permease subunit n=1 Tax=Motilimonas cestriensis TaxID=2742685 RepID=A0ABS8W4I2_9GAMM|nr:lipoprotein-releasing ABC transporter permease subunit [Motilimonas cestriensis]MCE2593297.1 lipoprotein-releasing ABC transporter permease subunit [Motilimonas cestriensis]